MCLPDRRRGFALFSYGQRSQSGGLDQTLKPSNPLLKCSLTLILLHNYLTSLLLGARNATSFTVLTHRVGIRSVDTADFAPATWIDLSAR